MADHRGSFGKQDLDPAYIRYAPKTMTLHRAYDETDPRLKDAPYEDSLAWYNARTGDVVIAFHRIDPDGSMRNDKFRAVCMGLARHEAAHAAYSRWMEHSSLAKLPPEIVNTLALFEEARVEFRAINSQLDVRPFFRAALRQGLGRHDSAMNTGDVAMAWGIMAGRRLARTIYQDEFEGIDVAARNAIGDETVDQLWDILSEAVSMSTSHNRGVKAMIALAIEWNELAGIPSSPMKSDISKSKAGSEGKPEKGEGKGEGKGKGDDEGEEEGDGSGEGEGEGDGESEGGGAGEGDEGDGDGDASGSSGMSGTSGESGAGKDTKHGLGESKGAEAIPEDEKGEDASGEGDTGYEDGTKDDQRSTADNEGDHHGFGAGGTKGIPAEKRAEFERSLEEAVKEVVQRFDDNRVETANPLQTASKVFGSTPKYDGHDEYSSWRERDPSREVRLAATSLARQLEQVSTPTITKTRVNKALPPGRLRTREAVRGSAERSRGMMVSNKPWRGEKRTHTQAPPATIGVMTDVSGSMSWAENTVAELSYIFAHAGNMVGARTAAVVFGNETEMTVAPGEVPTKLRVHAADGGSESCDTAYAALDGVLHFTDGPRGNKILVVFSDGHFVSAPDAAANPVWQKRICDAGVTIIWVNRDKPHGIHDKRIQVVTVGSDTQSMVDRVMVAIKKGVEENAHHG